MQLLPWEPRQAAGQPDSLWLFGPPPASHTCVPPHDCCVPAGPAAGGEEEEEAALDDVQELFSLFTQVSPSS